MIDYSLRLSKDIVRKLIINKINGLVSFWYSFKEYQYIWFWSVYFIDFVLFHKNLWINDMISFEKDNIDRPSFNRPYDFINVVQWSFSEKFETKIDFSKKIILWLDYESPLKDEILQDIDNIIRYKIKPGFILIITLHCKIPGCDDNKRKEEYLNNFWEEGHIYLKKNTVVSWNETILKEPTKDEIIRENKLEKRYLEILKWKVDNCLKDNILENKLLFSYSYQDWAKMVTLWFIFDNKENINRIGNICDTEENFTNISVPILTLREKKQIDQNMEALREVLLSEKDDKEKRKLIKKILGFQLGIDEINSYITYHSEYPHFAEIIV